MEANNVRSVFGILPHTLHLTLIYLKFFLTISEKMRLWRFKMYILSQLFKNIERGARKYRVSGYIEEIIKCFLKQCCVILVILTISFLEMLITTKSGRVPWMYLSQEINMQTACCSNLLTCACGLWSVILLQPSWS